MTATLQVKCHLETSITAPTTSSHGIIYIPYIVVQAFALILQSHGVQIPSHITAARAGLLLKILRS